MSARVLTAPFVEADEQPLPNIHDQAERAAGIITGLSLTTRQDDLVAVLELFAEAILEAAREETIHHHPFRLGTLISKTQANVAGVPR